jgi:hypothetical protein
MECLESIIKKNLKKKYLQNSKVGLFLRKPERKSEIIIEEKRMVRILERKYQKLDKSLGI